MEWISVKDRLPDLIENKDFLTNTSLKRSKHVLCLDNSKRQHILYLDDSRYLMHGMEAKIWRNGFNNSSCFFEDITHWMSLPEPPNDEWINIYLLPPEIEKLVLLTNREEVTLGYLRIDLKLKSYYLECSHDIEGIDHWLELPELPKELNNEQQNRTTKDVTQASKNTLGQYDT